MSLLPAAAFREPQMLFRFGRVVDDPAGIGDQSEVLVNGVAAGFGYVGISEVWTDDHRRALRRGEVENQGVFHINFGRRMYEN